MTNKTTDSPSHINELYVYLAEEMGSTATARDFVLAYRRFERLEHIPVEDRKTIQRRIMHDITTGKLLVPPDETESLDRILYRA